MKIRLILSLLISNKINMYLTEDTEINTCVHVISFTFVNIFTALVLRVFFAFIGWENIFSYLIGRRHPALLQ